MRLLIKHITAIIHRIRNSKLFRNKYVIVVLIFLLWILFFDENNIMAHRKNKQRLKALKEQCVYYREKIEADKQKMEELRSGTRSLEKYARENFYMTKPGEELFLIVED